MGVENAWRDRRATLAELADEDEKLIERLQAKPLEAESWAWETLCGSLVRRGYELTDVA